MNDRQSRRPSRCWPLIVVALLCFAACVETRPVALPRDQTAQPLRVFTVHGCSRGDTCLISVAHESARLERPLEVRLVGLDVPDEASTCDKERLLARKARRFTEDLLSKAGQLLITDALPIDERTISGRLVADGEDVGAKLLEQGLAVRHDYGVKAEWCSS